jgi:DNA-binding response OmpR family regulator
MRLTAASLEGVRPMTGKTLQLLLVEDDLAHAELIRQAFRSYDEQVHLTVVRSLREARVILSTTVLDLAIIDLLLPDGRAWNCCRVMKALRLILP